MATDVKSVQNQKAFVHLSAVTNLQRRYLQAVEDYKRKKAESLKVNNELAYSNARVVRQTLEQVIDMLDLPIAKEAY